MIDCFIISVSAFYFTEKRVEIFMKRLSISLLLLFSVLVVSAQLRWDVKAGVSLANMSHADCGAKFGYTVGLGAIMLSVICSLCRYE